MVLPAVLAAALPFVASVGAQPQDKGSSFPFRLYQKVAKERTKSNLLISPLSVSTALSMTYPGAAGETRKALSDVLNFAGADDATVGARAKSTLDSLRKPGGGTKLEIANALFGEKRVKFKQPFLDADKTNFDAEIQSLNFASPEAVTTINSWVSAKTHGKIPTIIDKIGEDAILYLINAIYFKGTWEHKFDKSQTTDEDFSTAAGGTKKVKMMNMHRSDFQYFKTDDFQAVNLKYADKRLSMSIFLPNAGKSLSAFEAEFTQENWDDWRRNFFKHAGQIGLPRFKIEDKMTLNDPLAAIGLAIAFDQNKADFSKMAEVAQRVFISDVIHKTFMEVNEEGTEAAAVTAVTMAATSAPMHRVEPFRMIMDKPFFIVLSDDKTGEILFAGHIAQP